MFAWMTLFVLGQLFINYKHGVVASPFLHYAMYSDVIKVNTNYPVFEVTVNGKLLQGKGYRPQQWDKILLPLYYFKNINALSNKMYHSDIKRLMTAAHLSPNDARFIQQCHAEQFTEWYISYLQTIINQQVNILDIRYHTYHFNGQLLTPTDTSFLFSQLCN